MRKQFVTPFAIDSSKWTIVYFALILDCSGPILHTLYMAAIADCRVNLEPRSRLRWVDLHTSIVRVLSDCIDAAGWYRQYSHLGGGWALGRNHLEISNHFDAFCSPVVVMLYPKRRQPRYFVIQWADGMLSYRINKGPEVILKYGQIESTIKQKLIQFFKT